MVEFWILIRVYHLAIAQLLLIVNNAPAHNYLCNIGSFRPLPGVYVEKEIELVAS